MHASVRRLLTAALLALAVGPAPLAAQAARWRLETGRQEATVAETTARGFPALPASALVSVGAELRYAGDEVVAAFGRREVRFRVGSAEVRVEDETHTLAHAVYAYGGVVYVPAQFFAEHLAEASGGALAVDPRTRVVRRAASAQASPPPAAEPPRRTTTSAALSNRPADPPPAPRAPAAAPAPEPARRAARPSRPAQRRLVVVDAGHGGRDPGARGPGGTREKDVTLALARRLAEILRADPTIEVRMTRDRDTLIALRDRPRMANRWRAEGQPAVFVSLHANANPARSAQGFETYFLSEARTADAQRVADLENSAVQYEEEEEGGPSDALSFIFTDLRQNHYLRQSSDWAEIVQRRLDEVLSTPNRGVKQAGFAVLNGAFMPAILVEIGFISNPTEEQMIASPAVQDRMARQIALAVTDFFARPTADEDEGRRD